MANAQRERWSSRRGFLLAAVGSAVGLGNMWRFSYLTAENGGAAFVVLYVAFTLLVGLPVMLAELTIGRGAARSPIQALAHYGGPRWKALGFVFVAAGFLILSYYGVIAGWTVRYAGSALWAGYDSDPLARFEAIREGWAAFCFHVVFMAVTVLIVRGGVKAGIQRAAELMMPALFVLVCGIALYAATLEGSGPGYAYYFDTNFAEVVSRDVVSAAAGQAFFSLSLGMGAMMTYASYLTREHHLPNASIAIAGADFLVAFVAGLMVFPLIFALGLSDEVGASTLGALFVTLPKAFASMGAAGRVVGLCFFVALAVGALTSAISLLEVVVASTMDGFGWTRNRAAIVMGLAITLMGAPAAWNIGVLDVMDQVASNVFLVGGGFVLAVFTGWVMKDPMREVRQGAEGVGWFFLWRWLLRLVVPAVLLFVLIDAVPKTLGSVAELFGWGN
ncbi:MAG: sodium-dependent transporter [bacterium]